MKYPQIMVTFWVTFGLRKLLHFHLNYQFPNTGVDLIKIFGVNLLILFWKLCLSTTQKNAGNINTMVWLTKSVSKFKPKKFYEIWPLVWCRYFKVSKVVWCRCFGHSNWALLFIFWPFWPWDFFKNWAIFFSNLLVTLVVLFKLFNKPPFKLHP